MIDIQSIGSSSGGNCYLIKDSSKSRLLIECGVRWKKVQEATGFSTSSIDAALITHEHGDHANHVQGAIKAGLDIYTSQGTAEALGLTGYQVLHLKHLEAQAIGTWKVTPFNAVHDAAEPMGFFIQTKDDDRIMFLGDTHYCEFKFPGITHLMVEANFSEKILAKNVERGVVDPSLAQRIKRSHLSLEKVIDFLKENDTSVLQGIWLMHLSNANSDEKLFKTTIQKLTGVPVYVCQQ